MFLFLSKILPVFLFPAGLSAVLALVTVVAVLLGRHKIAIVAGLFSVVILWGGSTQFVAYHAMRSLESRFNPPQTFPPASAIVLLGGGSVPSIAPRTNVETNSFGDRITHAARLFHKGYAPHIIATGGKITYIYDFPGTEASSMSQLLVESFGVDSTRIIQEPLSRTTADHPGHVAKILADRGLEKKIILVTSAMHMSRSVGLFKKAGYTVYPAPCDYWMDARLQIQIFTFLPSAAALYATTTALHEYYGMLAFKAMGRM